MGPVCPLPAVIFRTFGPKLFCLALLSPEFTPHEIIREQASANIWLQKTAAEMSAPTTEFKELSALLFRVAQHTDIAKSGNPVIEHLIYPRLSGRPMRTASPPSGVSATRWLSAS
jgi:hypothetical protein